MVARLSRRGFLCHAAGAAAALPWLTRTALARSVRFCGIFAIMQTPFDPSDRIDWQDLEREADFCIRAGAHGIVWPQLAGEFYLLTEEERLRGAEVILHKTAGGESAVVIGVQAPMKELAVKFARHAVENGADAVIALPPFLGGVSIEAAADYYRTLARAVKVPVFIQNSGGSWGPGLSVPLIIQLAKEDSKLAYIKEEVEPVAHRVGEYARSGVMKAIFSGSSGRNLLDELAHGSSGTMPAAGFVDIAVQIYNLSAAGKSDEARSLFQKLLPMINMEEMYGLSFVKSVLVRRGVFKTAKLRGNTSTTMDAVDVQELDAWWKQLSPHFKV
ncbi:MAG TPA: dihydrodipicolinate synthase family protein [Terriglobia bacterium]|nr:dihydrodipicolinate synthase family protein [Terriglobia bacterium]